GVERFGQVIVCTCSKALNLVMGLIACCQHQDRHGIALLANGLAYVEAVHAGQHDVEDHQIETFVEDATFCFAAISGAFDIVAFSLQHVGEGDDKCRLVFNQENASHDRSSLLARRHRGNVQSKACSLFRTRHADAASERLHYGFHNVKAKATARNAIRVLTPEERLEQVRKI